MKEDHSKMELGLEEGTVRLVPYNPQWSVLFLEEAKRLRALMENQLVDIQHIGSTAIPEIAAKPIIDIAVALKTIHELNQVVDALRCVGYDYKGEYGLVGRHFFTKGHPAMYHVHVVEWPSAHWRRWIMFRDRLRADKKLCEDYLNLKHELLKKYGNDRKAYTAAKDTFVEKVIE